MRSVDLLIIILCALSVAMSISCLAKMIWLEHFVCYFCKGEKDD